MRSLNDLLMFMAMIVVTFVCSQQAQAQVIKGDPRFDDLARKYEALSAENKVIKADVAELRKQLLSVRASPAAAGACTIDPTTGKMVCDQPQGVGACATGACGNAAAPMRGSTNYRSSMSYNASYNEGGGGHQMTKRQARKADRQARRGGGGGKRGGGMKGGGACASRG